MGHYQNIQPVEKCKTWEKYNGIAENLLWLAKTRYKQLSKTS